MYLGVLGSHGKLKIKHEASEELVLINKLVCLCVHVMYVAILVILCIIGRDSWNVLL